MRQLASRIKNNAVPSACFTLSRRRLFVLPWALIVSTEQLSEHIMLEASADLLRAQGTMPEPVASLGQSRGLYCDVQ